VARVVKEHDERRNEILETAQGLFYSKGYRQASVQDIINHVGIAKGTFYHYFGSKAELLNELVERMLHDALQLIEPIVADDELNALEKFNRCFRDGLAWKGEHRAFLLGILPPFYSDENALFRHKLKAAATQGIVPLLTQIIRQGVAEGVFETDYPGDVAQIVLAIGQWLSDTIALMLLRADEKADPLPLIEQQVTVVNQATERVLGAPAGSLQMVDLETLKQWFE
jgi:AcrR family transcriptional regulator